MPITPVSADRAPTIDNLRGDAAKIADQIVQAWDGEVDCVVILTQKVVHGTALDIAIVSSVTQHELLKKILLTGVDSVKKMKSITKRVFGG